jgi:hypothetical protein
VEHYEKKHKQQKILNKSMNKQGNMRRATGEEEDPSSEPSRKTQSVFIVREIHMVF